MSTQNKSVVLGSDLMLFVKQGETVKSLAWATSHTLTLTGDSVDTTTKDSGEFSGSKVTKLSWEISSENLYSAEDFATLFDAWTGRTSLDVVFGVCSSHLTDDENAEGVIKFDHVPGTASASNIQYKGKAYITSLSSNANAGEAATFSVTLTGTGALSKVTTV